MESRGEEFVRNIKAKQEKQELEQRISELNSIDTTQKQEEPIIEEEVVDLPAQELGDILLSEKQNPADKKRYIILGLALVVLFILTIVIIRLISSPSDEKKLIEKTEEIAQDKVASETSIEQQYQEIINQKLKKIKDDTKDEIARREDAPIDIDEIQKKEQTIVKPKAKIEEPEEKVKQDVFEMEEKTTLQKKVASAKAEELKKIVEKKVIKAPTPKISNVTKPKGYFIQIGAFSNGPSKALLANIKRYGFNYTLYDVVVKNKKYTKVLVGSFPNRKVADKDLTLVRRVLKAPNAYILNFK